MVGSVNGVVHCTVIGFQILTQQNMVYAEKHPMLVI